MLYRSTCPFKKRHVFIALIALIAANGAAAQSSETGPDARSANDVTINFGTLLPSKNGLTESVPIWGLKYSLPTSKGIFEVGGLSGIGNGTVYRSASLDYRMDATIDPIAAHFLLGFHADRYSSEMASSNFAGGWHYGGGITQYISGPILMRFDFRHRFSPGQILEVTLGITYRLGGATASGN